MGCTVKIILSFYSREDAEMDRNAVYSEMQMEVALCLPNLMYKIPVSIHTLRASNLMHSTQHIPSQPRVNGQSFLAVLSDEKKMLLFCSASF